MFGEVPPSNSGPASAAASAASAALRAQAQAQAHTQAHTQGPSTPRYTSFLQNMNILNRPSNPNPDPNSDPSKRTSTSRPSRSIFPILPNPFDHIHPALRSPFSRGTGGSEQPLPSPASMSQYSTAGPHPFEPAAQAPRTPRRSLFPSFRRAEAAVIDHGGNVPIQLNVDVESEAEDGGAGPQWREWPSRSGGRRTHHRRRRRRASEKRKTNAPIWFPAMKSAKVRAKMLHSAIFGSILLMLLITYLALRTTGASADSYQVVFIIMFIFLAIALIHTLLRLWLLIRRWNMRQRKRGDQESIYAPSNEQAIPVILARDEEIGISGSASDEELEKETAASAAPQVARPPPAYGLWRGSVRADPNLLHWQRRASDTQTVFPEVASDQVPRPPSYTPPAQHAARMDGGFF